jgi:hypothetical protein
MPNTNRNSTPRPSMVIGPRRVPIRAKVVGRFPPGDSKLRGTTDAQR